MFDFVLDSGRLFPLCLEFNVLQWWTFLLNLQDFYEDLFEELSKYGVIESLNICDNLADHMVIF